MAEKFGRYSLIDKIGIGGMAEVFLARHTGVEGFEKEIVIKRIRSHLSESPEFVNMFLGEAKLAAQLNHPSIVQIYDLGKIKDSFFIAMEYIPGRDMSAVIPKSKLTGIPFPLEYAFKIAGHVCEALYYAHTKADQMGVPLNIVHRDVSPENIRVAWTGTVKILDFGIAKAATQIHETKAGQIKGKVSCMSPEQVLGKTVDRRSDIFSLGIVLYEWISGFKLFSGDNDLAIMNNIIEGKIYPPSYFRDNIPAEAETILMKALEKNPKDRYQSAADMQLDIDTFLAEHEFMPSNIHLSNFMKQLFKDELAAEQAKRTQLGQETSDLGELSVNIENPLLKNQQEEADSNLLNVNPKLIEEEKTKEGLLLHLEGAEMQTLEALAHSRNMSMENIAEDIISHYLKYRD
ncbi:MAG: serine/threonine-protein kinase [Myxococcota bacterium]|nr:serine/threonine-protein kinase [Myxococcota bacterium]